MAQPLDPAVQQLLAQAAIPPPPPVPEPLSLAERAQQFRMWRMPLPERPAFAGTIEDLLVPVRWGSVAVRLYRPQQAEATPPVVAFFHGGGFIAGDLESHDGLCRELASASGCLVLAVDYRLAPEYPFPAGLEDAYDATRWLAQQAAALGGDASRLAVAGDSAGANLATAVALMARGQDLAIGFQLLLYPKLDFINEYPSHSENRALGIPLAISQFFDDCYIPNVAQRSGPLASPVLASDLHGMPPGLIVTADADTLRDEAEAYGHALRLAGAEVGILRAIGQVHGFATMTDMVPSALLITRAAAALLGDTLRRRS
ncbi:MAG: alpha/beta hydrolase [Roseiflexaceae bacterium]